MCLAHSLHIRGGRQGGGFQTAAAAVEITNVGTTPCLLAGVPKVELLNTSGKALPVQQPAQKASPNVTVNDVVLTPLGGTASLLLSWRNWCGGNPGPLRVTLTLPAGDQTTGDFDGPPDYDYVPGCTQASQPSSIEIVSAYTPAT